MDIIISDEFKAICPGTALGILRYEATVAASSSELLGVFDRAAEKLSRQYTIDTVAENPHIAAARRAYKALGKSPQEYRNAAEAMLRRIVKNSGLYHICNVVEINNLISVSSGYSIGSYDADALKGAVELRRADDGARYDGIGKGSVNIERLPVLYDELGPFGSPTSDSRRAMIQTGRRKILSVLYSFDGPGDLVFWMERYSQNLEQYCGVRGIETRIV
ncbi:B3/B4 domain-containing protein [Breznakiella homolactica]|uniref:B3/B4 tRNA-binding domain-containing protein n=1 Tax=Breznakiella homolactica TaxID=2798577 RepID=A0A7T7XK55_9SPIR|nr:phenylalanine--tRNA ligase beta subunit-related protein [Breznakiella homolactica]QQO07733.1 hypothetical protein JFL75_12340 [Breznakiella homolactica]